MKYLKASVSLPGCREEHKDTDKSVILSPIITSVCITLTDSIAQPAAYFPGSVIWQLLWTGAVQCGGLQPDNCGPCLLLVNALKCHHPTPSTPPPDPVFRLSSPVQPALQHQCLIALLPPPPLAHSLSHRHTHLVNLGHATTVSHLQKWVKNTKLGFFIILSTLDTRHYTPPPP